MKKHFNLKNLLSSIILIVFAVYLIFNLDSFRPLLGLNYIYLLFIAFLTVAGIVINGIFTKVIMDFFQKPIDVKESIFVSLIATAGNFFAPAGSGFGFRAVYLKKKHKLPYSDYLSMLSGNYVMVFIVVSLLGMVSLAFIDTQDTIAAVEVTLWLVFMSLFLLSLALLVVKVPKKALKKVDRKGIVGRVLNILVNISDGWNRITSNYALVWKLLGLILANTLISVVSVALIMRSLNFDFTIPALLLFSALGSLSTFINITPANLGVKEAVYLASASVLSFNTDQILSIALVERGVLFFVIALLWFTVGRSGKAKADHELRDN
jgi:uncharacterized protein (TIRG00374 family)